LFLCIISISTSFGIHYQLTHSLTHSQQQQQQEKREKREKKGLASISIEI
jgi:hypothetical protein